MIDDRLADLVAPLRAAPGRSAVLLDVDGTLAPITRHASETAVPAATREALRALAGRFGLVACVTGRRAAEARRIVGLDAVDYVGNHGTEALRAGASEPDVRPEVAAWEPRVRAVAAELLGDAPRARELGVWIEDKGPIQALHWRGASDEDEADALVAGLGERAEAAGLALHRGRMVLELRPPVAFDKGVAVRWLLGDGALDGGLFAGDDRTDVDGFRGLRELRDAGTIERAVCVAAVDEESPAAVADAADATVAGPDGVRELLAALVAA
ncbi:trehalose-phosphatase [Patulibacter sp. S7RM1-6]